MYKLLYGVWPGAFHLWEGRQLCESINKLTSLHQVFLGSW